MRPVRCVVFDIDDTLYLERDYVRGGFEAVGRWIGSEFGIHDFSARAWCEFEAGRRGDIFDRVLTACGHRAQPELVRAMVSVYRAHPPAISLLEDAEACLRTITGRAVIAAVSDGPLKSQKAKVDALHLVRWINPIVLTAALGDAFGKPNPLAFELVQRATGCVGSVCACVADNPAKDFAGPTYLRWRTVRVRRRDGLHVALPSGDDVHHEIDDLTSLPDLLGLST